MKDFCVHCGQPHPSVYVYTDDKGEERYVHDRCSSAYTKKILQPFKGATYDTSVSTDGGSAPSGSAHRGLG
jgi:hypothetical protein